MNKIKRRIDVSEKVANYLTEKYLWGRNEHALFIGKMKYKLSTKREKSTGIFLLSRGALYVFNNPAVKNPSLRMHINLLRCRSIQFKNHAIFLSIPMMRLDESLIGESDQKYTVLPLPLPGMTMSTLDEQEEDPNEKKKSKKSERKQNEESKENLDNPENPEQKVEDNDEEEEMNDQRFQRKKNIKFVNLLVHPCDNSKYLFKRMCDIIYTNLWHVEYAVKPKIRFVGISIPQPKRGEHSLKRRALIMAHYCFSKGESLECADYFKNKWNGEPILVIGPTFHPGGYAIPFGAAVGFESSLTTLVMKNSNFSLISQFLSAVINSSQTITTLGFTDYSRGKSPSLDVPEIIRTTIKSIILNNCCSDMVNSVTYIIDQLPAPIESFTLACHSYNQTDSETVFQAISTSYNLQKLTSLAFSHLNFAVFPMKAFSSLCSSLDNLECLEISHINIDGSQIIEAACADAPKIRKLILKGMKFENEWKIQKNFNLPVTLSLLNISETHFAHSSFANFLQNITAKLTKVPFFLICRSLKFSESAFTEFQSNFDPSKCQSNLLEFDMSDNMIPKLAFGPLFTFIQTQERLRNLIFTNVSTDDQLNFLHKLSAVKPGPIFSGIDLSGQFKPIMIHQFITSIPNSSQLRHLSLKNSHAGNKGFDHVANLLNILTNLNEIEIDGMQPQSKEGNEKHPLIKCWEKIKNNKTLTANDLPIIDLSELGFSIEQLTPEEAEEQLKAIEEANEANKKEDKEETKPPDADMPIYKIDPRLGEHISLIEGLLPPNRTTPTTIDGRVNFLIAAMKTSNLDAIRLAISPDVFLIMNKHLSTEDAIAHLPELAKTSMKRTVIQKSQSTFNRPMFKSIALNKSMEQLPRFSNQKRDQSDSDDNHNNNPQSISKLVDVIVPEINNGEDAFEMDLDSSSDSSSLSGDSGFEDSDVDDKDDSDQFFSMSTEGEQEVQPKPLAKRATIIISAVNQPKKKKKKQHKTHSEGGNNEEKSPRPDENEKKKKTNDNDASETATTSGRKVKKVKKIKKKSTKTSLDKGEEHLSEKTLSSESKLKISKNDKSEKSLKSDKSDQSEKSEKSKGLLAKSEKQESSSKQRSKQSGVEPKDKDFRHESESKKKSTKRDDSSSEYLSEPKSKSEVKNKLSSSSPKPKANPDRSNRSQSSKTMESASQTRHNNSVPKEKADRSISQNGKSQNSRSKSGKSQPAAFGAMRHQPSKPAASRVVDDYSSESL